MNLDLTEVSHALISSLRRRWVLSATVLLVTVVSAAATLPLVSPRYQVHARILTRDAPNLQSISTLNQAGGRSSKASKDLIELTNSRSYRESILDRTQLKMRWFEERPWLGRWTDRILLAAKSSPTAEDFHESLLAVLDEKLVVYLEENTIVFQVDWHSPHTAWLLADSSVQAFLDDRYKEELGTLQERLGLLESALAQANQRVADAIAKVEVETNSLDEIGLAMFPKKPPQTQQPQISSESLPETLQVLELRQELEELEGWLQKEETAYRRAIDEAEVKLAGLQETLGPRHPDIVDAVELLARQRNPSETLQYLRDQRADLTERLRATEASVEKPSFPVVAVPLSEENPLPFRGDVPDSLGSRAQVGLEEATTSLKYWMDQRNDAERRLRENRIELLAAQASFQHRYQLTIPPRTPREPVFPQPLPSLLTALTIACVLALTAPFLFELSTGHTHDPRLTSARIGVPLMGTIPLALLSGPNEPSREPGC